MKNYSIAVTTTETTETIQPSKYLILTAGAVDVQVKLQ